MKKQTALEAICALLILLFVYTAVNKLLNFSVFKRDMHNQPFAAWIADLVTIFLPPFELLIAILLPFTRTRKTGLWLSVILMFLFTIYTVIVLLRFFTRIPCGCGGFIRTLSWPQHLVFNIFFTALAATGIILHRKTNSISKSTPT